MGTTMSSSVYSSRKATMTKKDYIAIATAIHHAQTALLYASTNTGETKRSIAIVTSYIETVLAIDNTRFDANRFHIACINGTGIK